MSDHKSTVPRTAAFWLVLVLHLALGAALYYHTTGHTADQAGHNQPHATTLEKP